MSASLRHDFSFASMIAEIGSPVASVCASSSTPVRNGYATGVSSTLIRSAPVAVSSTTKPPPTE